MAKTVPVGTKIRIVDELPQLRPGRNIWNPQMDRLFGREFITENVPTNGSNSHYDVIVEGFQSWCLQPEYFTVIPVAPPPEPKPPPTKESIQRKRLRLVED